MVDDLQKRIAARLDEALTRQYAGDVFTEARCGMVDLGREPSGGDPCIRLSIEDVARIATDEACR